MKPSPSLPGRRARRIAPGLLILLLAAACAAPAPAPGTAQQASDEPVVREGWFHTVMNGSPRYYLIDRQGGSIELLLENEARASAGRGMTFDRQHVRVSGRWRDGERGRLVVEEIRRAMPGDDR
jgi:hypothetical protein